MSLDMFDLRKASEDGSDGRGISIVTEALCITSQSRRGKETAILKNINFAVLRGEMTAIMGPSGSGKTTLLNMLAGRITKRLLVGGKVYFNGRECPPQQVREFSSFVMQEDHFLQYLTVQETLHFSAMLRLQDCTQQQRDQRVADCLDDLGLRSCRDVLVGGPTLKGISGGQRKRVSIAIALLSDPPLLFLDEPTSGLDASLAYDVIKILDSIAQRYGRTIICTIHQPRPQVYQLFDTLLLLRLGETVYRGPTAEAAKYFESLGYPCPEDFNPSDFLLDLLATDDGDAVVDDKLEVADSSQNEKNIVSSHSTNKDETVESSSSIVRVFVPSEEASRFAKKFAESQLAGVQKDLASDLMKDPMDISTTIASPHGIGQWLRSVMILIQRDLRNNWRNTSDLKVMLTTSFLITLIFGTIWWQIPWPKISMEYCEVDNVKLRNIMGGMIQPLGKTAFDSFDTALSVVQRRALVNREAASGLYSHSARFISSAISDMTMTYIGAMLMGIISYWCFGLAADPARFFTFCVIMFVMKFCATSYALLCGSLAKNTAVASALLPLGTVLFFFTSGLQVTDGDVPHWLVWLQNLSYIRFLFQGFVRDQFQNDEYLDICAGFQTPHGAWTNVGIAFAIACGLRFFAFIAQCFMHKHVGMES